VTCVFALAACLLTPALAVAAERTHTIVPEDYFSVAVITGCAASPDGRMAAYTDQRWEPPAEKRNTDLWIVDAATGRPRRLTFDKANEGSPRWSPDGAYIYFTSNPQRGEDTDPPYNGKKQVWRVTGAAEPQAVTRAKDGIGLYDLTLDGRYVYYTKGHEVVDDDFKDLREKYDDLEYGHGVTEFSQIWRLDLVTWREEKIVDEKRVIGAFHVSPDQKRIAMLTTPDATLLSNEGWSRVDVYDADTKTVTTLTDTLWRKGVASPYGWLDDVAWSGDSAALAMTVSWDGHPAELYVAEWTEDKPNVRKLTREGEVHVIGGSMEWQPGTRNLAYLGEDRARTRVYRIADVKDNTQGATDILTPGDVVVSSYSFARVGGGMYVALATTTHLDDIYYVQADTVEGQRRFDRLTDVNPQTAEWKWPQISVVEWTAPDGAKVEGILELPPDHKPEDGPLPMVVEIHGGPTAATTYQFNLRIYGEATLAASGYARFSPNYRGSTGYGDKFMTDLVGRENDIEVKDILAGVDAMVERGIADPQRLGVMGWSNGGYLTNCLITQTTRFKAASSGAGVLDMVIQWGLEDTPGHVINFMGAKLPWQDAAKYQASSPLYNLHKVTTPTLIHVGGDDPRCPPGHSQTLYRGLKHYVGTPTELVTYPNEGHGLTTYTNRKAKMAWDMAWFEKYLVAETAEPKAATESNVE
jgi:dipeptidyl aminopeptidase/acylaminoacyl peptidase